MAERTNSDTEAMILEGNRQGKSGQVMATELGMSKSAVCRILKRHGVESNIGRPAWLALDHTAFDIITPESAYWMGFLFADGSIGEYGQGAATLQLTLSENDIGHVQKLRSFLKSDHKIQNLKVKPDKLVKTVRDAARLSVRSERLVAALVQRGYIGLKQSAERCPTSELEDSRDFWRGMVDGDGTVRVTADGRGTEYPNIMLYGHMPVMEKFQSFLMRQGIFANITDASTCIFQVRLLGAGALSVIKLLYENAETFLDRKMKTAAEILEQHSR